MLRELILTMKKMIIAVWRVLLTNCRLMFGKLAHGRNLKYGIATCLAASDEVFISHRGRLDFGQGLRTRGHCCFNVQENGSLVFEDDVFINAGCRFNCHKRIVVGSGCEFGPYVVVYDHDHDFRAIEGLKGGSFSYGDVAIGKNCWIGANVVILRGTEIGDNCVIAAGSVVKGKIPEGSIFIQKRYADVRKIDK